MNCVALFEQKNSSLNGGRFNQRRCGRWYLSFRVCSSVALSHAYTLLICMYGPGNPLIPQPILSQPHARMCPCSHCAGLLIPSYLHTTLSGIIQHPPLSNHHSFPALFPDRTLMDPQVKLTTVANCSQLCFARQSENQCTTRWAQLGGQTVPKCCY